MKSREASRPGCVFCRIAAGENSDRTRYPAVVYRDDDLTAFMSLHWWNHNKGHVIVIPNKHYENLYAMPDDLLGKVAALSKQIALAMKQAYGCDGTSIRQNNESAGGQDVWHYHIHVIPRYVGDDLNHAAQRLTTVNERAEYANRLCSALLKQY